MKLFERCVLTSVLKYPPMLYIRPSFVKHSNCRIFFHHFPVLPSSTSYQEDACRWNVYHDACVFNLSTHIYIYVFIYVCVRIYVCMYVQYRICSLSTVHTIAYDLTHASHVTKLTLARPKPLYISGDVSRDNLSDLHVHQRCLFLLPFFFLFRVTERFHKSIYRILGEFSLAKRLDLQL